MTGSMVAPVAARRVRLVLFGQRRLRGHDRAGGGGALPPCGQSRVVTGAARHVLKENRREDRGRDDAEGGQDKSGAEGPAPARTLLDPAEHAGAKSGRWRGEWKRSEERGLTRVHLGRLPALRAPSEVLLEARILLCRQLAAARQQLLSLVVAHISLP